jgi:hypothetical protein
MTVATKMNVTLPPDRIRQGTMKTRSAVPDLIRDLFDRQAAPAQRPGLRRN